MKENNCSIEAIMREYDISKDQKFIKDTGFKWRSKFFKHYRKNADGLLEFLNFVCNKYQINIVLSHIERENDTDFIIIFYEDLFWRSVSLRVFWWSIVANYWKIEDISEIISDFFNEIYDWIEYEKEKRIQEVLDMPAFKDIFEKRMYIEHWSHEEEYEDLKKEKKKKKEERQELVDWFCADLRKVNKENENLKNKQKSLKDKIKSLEKIERELLKERHDLNTKLKIAEHKVESITNTKWYKIFK